MTKALVISKNQEVILQRQVKQRLIMNHAQDDLRICRVKLRLLINQENEALLAYEKAKQTHKRLGILYDECV